MATNNTLSNYPAGGMSRYYQGPVNPRQPSTTQPLVARTPVNVQGAINANTAMGGTNVAKSTPNAPVSQSVGNTPPVGTQAPDQNEINRQAVADLTKSATDVQNQFNQFMQDQRTEQRQQQQQQPQNLQGIIDLAVQRANMNKYQQNYLAALGQTAQGNIPIGQQAMDIARQYEERIRDLTRQSEREQLGELTTGLQPMAAGNAALIAKARAGELQGLAAAEEAALKGTAQGLTAQQQAAGAFGQGLTGAGTAQQAAITATLGAGGLARPEAVPYTSQYISPATGQPVSGAGGAAVKTLLTNLATKVKNNEVDPATAMQQASQYGPENMQTFLNELGPGFNAIQAQAQAAIQAQQEEQYQAYQSAHKQATNLQNQFKDLLTTMDLNPNDLNAANAAIQKIAANTSDPRYKILQNYINDIAQTYAPVFTPSGANPTDYVRGIADSMLDQTMKGSALMDVLNAVDQQAAAKISGVKTIKTSGASGAGTTGTQTKVTRNAQGIPVSMSF